jgi:hypothetical protein
MRSSYDQGGQLPKAPIYTGRYNITVNNRKYGVEQIFKEYRFEGAPNY